MTKRCDEPVGPSSHRPGARTAPTRARTAPTRTGKSRPILVASEERFLTDLSEKMVDQVAPSSTFPPRESKLHDSKTGDSSILRTLKRITSVFFPKCTREKCEHIEYEAFIHSTTTDLPKTTTLTTSTATSIEVYNAAPSSEQNRNFTGLSYDDIMPLIKLLLARTSERQP